MQRFDGSTCSRGVRCSLRRGASLMALAAVLCLAVMAGTLRPAAAAYGTVPSSHVDPEVVRIDENKFLGARVPADVPLVDDAGREFKLGDLLDKPLILVLSYYACDGACSTINSALNRALKDVGAWEMGKDYRVLTLSFNRDDTPASLAHFRHEIERRGRLSDAWTLALLKNPDDIERLTNAVGYKFFWEPRDRVFLHPSAYLMLSTEGRVTRYLYAASASSGDIEVAITQAYGKELAPANVINYLMSACYSYNYKDGKYAINYPIVIAGGAFGLGITSLIGGSIIMKRRAKS